MPSTSLEIGVQAPERNAVAEICGKGGRILLVDDRPSSYERLAPEFWAPSTPSTSKPTPAETVFAAQQTAITIY